MPITVQPYDPDWAARFELERATLELVLAAWLSGPVQHIGSTSVPGLASKPILDMIAGVSDLQRARAAVAPLASLGYVHAEHRPRALYFYRPADDDPNTESHHLHLTEPGSDIWRERLAFRDALRADPELVDRYLDLKRQLAAAHCDDLRAYTDGKRAFVTTVLAGVGIVADEHPTG